jgi:Protein of unknown function (DUF2934)
VKLRAIQRDVIDTYLKLVRLPFDTVISMVPDGGKGVMRPAKAAVDAADAGTRAVVAMILGERVSVDDTTAQRRQDDPNGQHDRRRHESKQPRAGRSKPRQETVREPRGRPRRKAAPGAQPAEATQRPAATAQGPAKPSAAQPAPGTRARAAAITGAAGRTAARTAPSGAGRRAPDVVAGEHRAPPASADRVSSEPSHEDIAARAYELYQRGVPGDAQSHWELAKRELTSEAR